MNTMKVSIAAGLVISGMVLASPFAVAADTTASRAVTVYFDELNMASDSGATALYSRLRSASRQVCAPLAGRELRQRAAFDACYTQALSNAVLQVNRAPVTALHMRSTKGAAS
jgi:UrcA family protein